MLNIKYGFASRYKRYYSPQIDERDCGVAALNMLLRYNKSDYSLARLRQLAKTDQEGTTALGIVRAAENLDFETSPIKTDMSLFDLEDVPYPFIAHVLKNGELLHYYVVFKATKKRILIGDPDPSEGMTWLSRERFEKEWSGVAIFIAPKPAYQPQKERKNGLFDFLPLLVRQKRIIANIIIAAALITVISIVGSYFLQSIIDTYIPNAMRTTMGMIASGLLLAYLLQAILTYGQNFLMAVLGQRLAIDVILGYVRHLYELPMSFFATRRTGEIISRFSDANKIIDALAHTMMTLFLDVWLVLVLGIVLGIQNGTLFLISLIAVPCYLVIVFAFQRPFDRLNQETMESNAVLSSSIIENLNGIETIKSLTGERASYERVDREFLGYLKKSFQYTKVDQLQQAIKGLLKLILNVVVLWVGANLVMANKMSLGQMLTFNALLSYFTNPLESIINLQPTLQTAKVANNRLNEVYLVESEFKEHRSVTNRSQIDGTIRVADVSFKYGFGQDILKQINLEVPENAKYTIVGMSGSGKSTLAKLLVGFYPVEANRGEITFNRVPMNDINLSTLRQYIEYVPQDPFIFSGSVLDNLTLGSRPHATEDDIKQACMTAEIAEDIAHLPQQWQTKLSESGSILSGGQKQRLAIARALLSPAKVLIFDESTSSLDTITERKIVNRLLAMKDRTIIFVAHRLTIAAKTERIIVMDHGELVEQGDHASLLARGGFYARLVSE
ncbi:peptide cleavage/export ABC transporter [Lacticaseibacillus zeae]|uniref:Peptide cleavage/export ABC transporter n=1 Tax=Lacticaseibacillus zeae subsp. silagei TaxID=3068307 RepID=A0ABD7Z9C7_LACZE|nr:MULTISPECIES: peptide cleavage/export ABC transporter [Lacticaseibacillus]MDE3316872.1 peptide cleavage/export ABC transporter [Lacticaseibacillus zeae]OFR98436.1 peptide ABC transporter ATP-binding protein [Lactobacillus sp. HMSC068F07]WLV83656.1 peptide cleavage/export ABC transporter [Lacticaseibacillus sp. NCIMB 15475]WLV86412.1 peptide cleavage/export ABC transporter [Lacticaseibacillus sp. NCIMB 15474]